MASEPNYGFTDVEVVSDESAYQGFYRVRSLRLRHRLFAGDWSDEIHRELFVRYDAVGVLLFDPVMDAVALVEQFRVGAYGHEHLSDKPLGGNQSPWLLELVAGLMDKEQTPEVVARRESEEEAGTLIQSMEPIGQYYTSPGGSTEYFHLFCGKADLSTTGGVHGLAEEAEDIRVHVLSVDKALQYLSDGKLNNAHTIIAMQWLQLNRERIKRQWL